MPPKRSKSQTGSAGAQKWEAGLLAAQFVDEGKWSASVSFVVCNRVEDFQNLDILAETVNSGCRKLFSVITKDELYETVRDLGNPKNPKKGREVPPFSEICEPCKSFLDSNDEIPLPLQARLIKYRLLDIKQRDIKRREAEKKSASDGPKSAAGKPGKGADKKGGDRAKSAGKGKGGKKTPDLPSAKNESKLKKRGEEDEEGKYIDDEPDDGPHHYVIISGFHSPHLPAQLAEIGITLDSVIRVCSEDYSKFEPKVADEDEVEPPPEKDEKTLAFEREAEKDKQRAEKELRVFWKDLKYLLRSTAPNLYDIARLEHIVKDEIIPEDLEDAEKKAEYGKALFEDVACMIYDMLDAKRQWKNYLDNLNLQHIPVFGEPVAASFPDGTSTAVPPTPSQKKADPNTVEDGKSMMAESEVKPPPEVDVRYYNEIMNAVPQESVSVPLIMHCMLEQVVATEEGLEPPSEVAKPKREDGLEESLAKHISSLAYKLALSDEEQELLAQDFEKPALPDMGAKQPLLMNHHDEMCERLNHLKPVDGLDPMKAELEMMGFLPIADLANFRSPSQKTMTERAARLQELVHFVATGGLTQAEVDRAFKQFVFECVDLTTTDEDGNVLVLTKKQRDVPWDDPYPYFRGMIPLEDEEEMEEPVEEVKAPSESGELKTEKGNTPHPKIEETPREIAVPESAPEDDGSRPSTPGILKRSDSAASRKSSSVHFEKTADGGLVPQPGDDAGDGEEAQQRPLHVTEEEWSEVNDRQQRNMDQWCFAEHLEPAVFLQVLRSAQHTHPFLDTYYHKRDHTLLVVLHNPMNEQLTSHVRWQTKLHSDVGFRNYMEHIATSIDDWTREQEAKYQASQLAREVEDITKEAEAGDSRPGSGKGKKGAAKDAKDKKAKSPTRSRSASRSSSQERQSTDNPYVRANSIKAWKEEQDKLKAEEEAKEREKEMKRIKSAEKKKEKEAKDKEEKNKKGKPGSRANSAKSKGSKDEVAEGAEDQEPKEPERYWPFYGYDVGNNLIEACGVTSAMYPADGGQIRVDKVEFVQGCTSVRTAVLKDGHSFMVHVQDPKVEGEDQPEAPTPPPTPTPRETIDDSGEKQDSERNEKELESEAVKKPCVGVFGSFSAQLRDGMNLSFSTYGESGEPVDGKKYAPEPYVPPTAPTPAPPADGKATPGKGKKDKGKAATPEPPPVPTEEEEAAKSESKAEESVKVSEQPFQQMHITCPDGLAVNYFLESAIGIQPETEESRKILVKQCYPFKTRGGQECEAARKRAMEEVSRVTNTEGTVVKTMVDGTVQVLFADGTVSQFVQNSPILPSGSRNASLERPGSGKSPERETPSPTKKASRQSRKSPRKKETVGEEPEEAPPTGFWITTAPNGDRVCTRLDGSKIKVKRALISMASDPATSQSMQTREDHVVTVMHPDGTMVVEHADGTRITTFWREITVTVAGDTSSETGETPDTEIKQVKVVVVECPGFATVKFDTNSILQCSTEFGSGTVIHISVDGSYDVYHSDGGYLQVDPDGSSSYFPRPNNELEVHNPNHQLQYNMRHFADVIVDTVDNEGNVFNVMNTGETSVQTATGAQVVAQEHNRENSTGEMVQEKAEAEQEGEKAIHTRKLTYYKQHAPRLFICHPDGSGTELLRYQDVAEYMANAEDDPTTAILMDSLPDYPGVMGITVLRPYNKGVSEQWLKPYIQDTIIPPGLVSRDLTTLPAREEKKPGPNFGSNVGTGLAVGSAVRALPAPPILKCPNKLEIRQILQYKPISEELRNGLCEGLRNYGEFVRTKLENIDLLLLQDPRSPEEQLSASRLQEMAAPQRESTMPVEGRASRIDGENIKHVYERATAPPIPSPPPTPQPKRTKADWERDERELAEEVANRNKLRNHDVPPYFQSELGKAFLLTQAPDMEAMTKMLKEDPRSDNSKAIRSNASSSASRHSSSAPPPEDGVYLTSDRSLSSTPPTGYQAPPVYQSPIETVHMGTTPSAVRPGNPTPAHAQGHGSPSSVRPNNPTPAHATKTVPERPGAPTPKQGKDSESPNSHTYPSIVEKPSEEDSSPNQASPAVQMGAQISPMPNSLNSNVIGTARLEPIKVPAYLQTGRPLAAPNFRHGMVEDPVRRKVYTSSVAGATPVGAEILARMRGFELLPTHVDFGVLREGSTYSFPVQLKNTGVDACRYKIKQPPPSTGIKIDYKPGPIAAGMKAEINVQIYAIANGVEGGRGVGHVRHKLSIITETDHLFLPIAATVLTAYEYDNRSPESPEGGKSPGVRYITDKAPGVQGITRLRKPIEA